MRRCAVCGTGNSVLTIQYRVRGFDCDTGKRVVRRINLCWVCDAWGMANKEKLAQLANVKEEGIRWS